MLFIIKSVPIWTDSAPIFQSFELLSVFEIYAFKIAMFTYKYIYNQVADSVYDLCTRTNELHNRVTCQSDKFYIPFSRLITVTMRFKRSYHMELNLWWCWSFFVDVVLLHSNTFKKVFVNTCIISLMMSDSIVCRFETMDIFLIRMSNCLHNCTFVTPS